MEADKKYPKALEEVWECKDKVYDSIKNKTPEEKIKFLHSSTEKIIKKLKLKIV